MKFGLAATAAGIGVLVVGVMGASQLIAPPTEVFTFSTTNGKGSMFYRCVVLDSPEETHANALSAHGFFEPLFMEATRQQAIAMHASSSPDRQASEIIPELERINATAAAHRAEADKDMQRRFGCSFRAEPA